MDKNHTNIITKLVVHGIKPTDSVPDVKVWKRLLSSLPNETDCVAVAYNKYCCRQQYYSLLQRVLLNIGSLAYLIAEIPFLCFSNRSMPKEKRRTLVIESLEKIDYRDIVPDSLIEQYDDVNVCPKVAKNLGTVFREGRSLLFRCIRKHPLSFCFNYWVCRELIRHTALIDMYDPQGTAVYVNERNVAGAIITEFYENDGRKFISFMHGEYLFQLIQAYMCFSEYYVWDSHYIEMFSNDLNCQIKKYIVYTPNKLKKKWRLEERTPQYYCTYYFSGESIQSIKVIADTFDQLGKKGKRVKIRPHPRTISYLDDIKKEFSEVVIEDPMKVGLEESLASTEYAIGLATTVLSEASVEGRKIVIDDISNPERYNSLKERKYIVLHREHILLSELLKDNGIEVDIS